LPLVVVDASVVAAILFGEASAEASVERLEGCDLAAPSLLPYEIVSVAGGKVQRGAVSAEAALGIVGAFRRLSIVLHEPDSLEVFRLTVQTKLTAYDAAYMWLARFLAVDLVTLDKQVERAWSRLAGGGSRSR